MGVDDSFPLIEPLVTGRLGHSFSSFSPRRVLALRPIPAATVLSLPLTLDFGDMRWTTGECECWWSRSLQLAPWSEDASESLEPFMRR